MKILKTNKITTYIVYLHTNIKPSDYADAEEMKILVNDVRPKLKEVVGDFIEANDKVMDVQKRFTVGELTQKDADVQLVIANKDLQRLELKTGEEELVLEFENEEFNKLMNFYNRTGKEWFATAERYMKFDNSINEANKQTKKDK